MLYCCCDTNPCGCSWPRVLTYTGSVTQSAASFYFFNTWDGYPAPEPSYTLTYGARPAAIPKELQLLYHSYPGGVSDPYYITMPDEAWFSPPIPGKIFTTPTTLFFYLWMQSCQANVMVLDAPYGVGFVPDGTKGAGNGIITYTQTACNPQFQMKKNLADPPWITGTHGGDDIDPSDAGNGGAFTNPRVGL